MIAFGFTFPAGRYHATPWGRHANEADVAWPPEPVRILRALIATWWRKADHEQFPKIRLDDLIDALAVETPVFHLPVAVHSHVRAFMPAPTDRKLIYDGFLRFDRDAEMIVAWPGVILTREQETLARHLLERIGYLGRAESWVEGRLAADWDGENNTCPRSMNTSPPSGRVPVDIIVPLTPAAWANLRKTLVSSTDSLTEHKRVVVSSTLPERLADAIAVDTSDWQEAGWSSPPPFCKIVYDRPAVSPLPPQRSRKPFVRTGQPDGPEVARFVLAGRPCPRIEQTLKIAEVMRWALMSGTGVPPVELSGRDDGGPMRADPAHAHAFYLPEDADGDGLIDHLILYCRGGFSDEARRRLDRLTRLWTEHGHADADGGRGRMEWRVALEGIASPKAFSSSPLLGAARTWRSVTPYLKPRFDKRRPDRFDALVDNYRAQIRMEWKRRFIEVPLPVIEPMTDSANPCRFAAPIGAGDTPRSTLAFVRTRSGRGGHQPDTAGGFFRLTFEQDVEGPIALGWGAHFGLGLFRRDD
ncbi:MAG: type I-U CRISPR-associated protein Cas5/Cas6 [Alphaproteobacteria bacterium]|nr:type I-U CRISPR-associated protein Cas5/Cas6 [Alphaproteobacteria bacterium]